MGKIDLPVGQLADDPDPVQEELHDVFTRSLWLVTQPLVGPLEAAPGLLRRRRGLPVADHPPGEVLQQGLLLRIREDQVIGRSDLPLFVAPKEHLDAGAIELNAVGGEVLDPLPVQGAQQGTGRQAMDGGVLAELGF